jgi:DNA-binding transcriptional LysR family regulator
MERTSAGVRPTSEGHALADKARALLGYYDSTVAEARKIVRGESDQLRIGYLASAGREYLGPAVAVLRRRHPQVKTKMLDLTTGQQIIALRRGEIDLALTCLGKELLSRDFYTRKLATVPNMVVLPLDHPLASQDRISFSQLKNDHFLRVPDTGAPGYNQKITEFCRRFGKFKPRFAAMREITRLTEGLSVAVDEGEILVNPIFISHLKIPNAVMVPIAETKATWDVFIAWQQGKTSGPLRALVER